jgi:hypothetical protein
MRPQHDWAAKLRKLNPNVSKAKGEGGPMAFIHALLGMAVIFTKTRTHGGFHVAGSRVVG